jgi:hypothetical protein
MAIDVAKNEKMAGKRSLRQTTRKRRDNAELWAVMPGVPMVRTRRCGKMAMTSWRFVHFQLGFSDGPTSHCLTVPNLVREPNFLMFVVSVGEIHKCLIRVLSKPCLRLSTQPTALATSRILMKRQQPFGATDPRLEALSGADRGACIGLTADPCGMMNARWPWL